MLLALAAMSTTLDARDNLDDAIASTMPKRWASRERKDWSRTDVVPMFGWGGGDAASPWSNLKADPPKPFDITRKVNIFTSRVQYVEFSVSNYNLTTRQIPLPPELVDVADDDLKNRITRRVRAPFDSIGKLEIKLDSDGKSETVEVDDQWLKKEKADRVYISHQQFRPHDSVQ
jgi:hypothetical protein